MNKLKMEALQTKLPIIVCCLLVAVFFILGTSYRYTMVEPRPLEDIPVEELKGSYVTVNLEFIYNNYTFTEEINTETKEHTITQREYLIDCGEDCFIGLALQGSDMTNADKLLQQSEAYLEGESSTIDGSFVVTGVVKSMSTNSLDFLHEAVDYDTLSASEKEMFLPLYIEPVNESQDLLMLGFALFFLCAGLYYLIPTLSGHNQRPVREKLLKLCGDNTAAMDRLLTELLTLPNTYGLRIGQGYLLCRVDAKHYLLDSNDLVWAYKQTTTKKAYGFIPMGKSHALALHTADGRQYTISMKDKQIKASLQLLTENFPNTVIGYSDQYQSYYNQSPDLLRKNIAMQHQG